MNPFLEFPFLVPLVAGVITEVGKLIGSYFSTSSIKWEDFFQSGGMPSGHTVFVISLATTLCMTEGVRSPDFAISFTLAGIVLYDALKLRRAAGQHATELNKIIGQQKFTERLGHTPFEVFMGICLGMGIPFCLLSFF